MKLLTLALVGLLALGGQTTTAQAQEQTVENAQKFLGILASQNQFTLSHRQNNYQWDEYYWTDDATDNTRHHHDITPPFKVNSARMSTRCATVLNTNVILYYGTVEGRFNTPTLKTDSQPPIDISIDWAKVAIVRREGNGVVISGNNYTNMTYYNYLRFNLPSEDLAKRVEYALEFMRLSCDAAASTGF
ncbi:hypothetical protein PQU92_17185 [Asticcacaulis sp. BYS171W]|uniref:Uncharacterized protein n=1 Tax=Asticcacaulis aquaticus TaxID=2984212 RepID=A0ABT5HY58_9CAUL|nr:hypothetical protein [Asticcacaulis aquaticus]MDC7685022.1 hypothetical protein [Asticcacaulis aquaticus]